MLLAAGPWLTVPSHLPPPRVCLRVPPASSFVMLLRCAASSQRLVLRSVRSPLAHAQQQRRQLQQQRRSIQHHSHHRRRQQQRQQQQQTAVGTHLMKGPPGFVPEDNVWVQETVRKLTLVHAHPWFTEQSNDEADNAVDVGEFLAGRRVAIFGVPAPFTGTCTTYHVPGYQALQEEFADVVDELVCFSVCDPFGMDGWRSSLQVDRAKITFLADTQGKTTKAWGLGWDLSAVSLGERSVRFSMLVDDGEVVAFNKVEDAAGDAAMLLEQCTAHATQS
jgi:peroxiredoxin